MAEAIVSFAIEKLANLLIQEGKLLWGVSDKIEELKDELMRIQCFLKDADAKQHGSESIRHSISEITNVAYDAEDILEKFVLQVASRRRGGVKNILKRLASIFGEALAMHQVGSKIDKFNAKLSNIRESFIASGIKEALQMQASTSSSQDRQPNHVFPHVVDTDLVGLEYKVDELVTNLVDIKYGAVSIWGMGGVGKTALAKQIYNHKQVRHHFGYFAWASISQQCQTKSQLEDIFIQLSNPWPSDRQIIKDLQLQDLAEELGTFMTNNKCLVVVDDIWNVEDWNSLKSAFPYESGSKILITTRVKNVALAMHGDLQQRSVIHELSCLNDEQSWELFQKIVFRGEKNADLEELGNKLVRHCKGLPLAIKVLGSLLASKKIKMEWEILYMDIESRPEGDDTLKVDNVLSLSYNHLPTELKPCFLYMGVFPEDCEISLEKLFHYWVAEGFVSSTTGNTADSNCMIQMRKLIEMSMVLKGKSEDMSLEMITCRMHDRMRHLCISKGEEEKFLQVDNLSSQTKKKDVLSRRFAVHFLEDTKNLREDRDNRNLDLWSLVYQISEYNNFEIKIESLWDLLFLRVLDLENVSFEGIASVEGIGKLIHLRYLSLRNCLLVRPLSSLTNLTLLLTLDLRISTYSLTVIPNLRSKMENLLHLYLPNKDVQNSKIELGSLKKLETLVNFEIGFMNVKDLLELVNLTRLTLFFWSDYRIKKENLIFNDTLKNLLYLEVKYFRTSELLYGFISQMVSACTNLSTLKVHGGAFIRSNTIFSKTITSMEFMECRFEEENPMSTFEKLPNLKYLKMDRVISLGTPVGGLRPSVRGLVWSTRGFPQLKYLYLLSLGQLEEWRVEEGAMPNLHRLEIGKCYDLMILPDGLRFIETLKELDIWDMRKAFCDRLKEGREDFHKFKHIPSIRYRKYDW